MLPRPDTKAIKKIHLVGICGTGMATLAGMLKERGFRVRGSDVNVYPPMSDLLAQLDIPVTQGYAEANLEPQPDLVVIGNALSRGNPEVEAVLDRTEGLPITLPEPANRSTIIIVWVSSIQLPHQIVSAGYQDLL